MSALGLDFSDGALIAGIPVPKPLIDLATQLGLPDGVSLALVSQLTTQSDVYFAQTTFHYLDFDLTLGARYQEEDRRVYESSINTANLDGSITELLQFDRPRKRDINLSPIVTLAYNFTGDVMTYATYTQGY